MFTFVNIYFIIGLYSKYRKEGWIMKKKILAGLLTVSACFSIGSTSFASSATSITTSPQPSAITQEVTTTGNLYQAIIHMKVGEVIFVSGSNLQLISTDGAIELRPDESKITALQPGASAVMADFGNGDVMIYTFLVK
jgi:hypothetical protein